MTLTSLHRYNRDRITDRRGHGIVVGASMAGMLAARVLANQVEVVTLVEGDSLPEEAVGCPGVTQGNQIHLMLTAGQSTLEVFFPGYGEGLTSAGAVEVDLLSDLKVFWEGDRSTVRACVAVMEAFQLNHVLATDGADRPAFPFFKRIQGLINDAWSVAV